MINFRDQWFHGLSILLFHSIFMMITHIAQGFCGLPKVVGVDSVSVVVKYEINMV